VHFSACLLGVSLLGVAPASATTTEPTPAASTSTTTSPTTSPTATPVTSDPTATPSTSSEAVPPPTDLEAATIIARPASGTRLAVGDSLMVGAGPLMRRAGFAIHAKVGRQFSTAPGIVRSYGRALPRNVVIELGTNGTVTLAACRAVVHAAGAKRRVFLVTNRVPRSWQDSNNATLAACDRSFPKARVHLVDWHGASAGRPEWFAADGIHTSAAGRAAFARLIDRAVDRYGH
jgi:hypothetical protein